MADEIFGQGLDPVPYVLVPTPAVVPAFGAARRPIYVQGLGTIAGANKGVAVANATDAASVIARLNDLLASLRAANIIAT